MAHLSEDKMNSSVAASDAVPSDEASLVQMVRTMLITESDCVHSPVCPVNSDELKSWKQRIQNDAESIWCSPEALEVWKHHGHDATELSESWKLHTLDWIISLLSTKVRPSRLERNYAKYLRRFEKARSNLQETMRISRFEEGIEKVNHLVEPLFSPSVLCDKIDKKICLMFESESLIYHVIRQRADIFVNMQ